MNEKDFHCVKCKNTGYFPDTTRDGGDFYLDYYDDTEYCSFRRCDCVHRHELEFNYRSFKKQEEIAKKHGVLPLLRWFVPED